MSTMAKRKANPSKQDQKHNSTDASDPGQAVGFRVVADDAIEPDAPRAKRYVPRECTSCTAIRPSGRSYSEVYGTVGSIRYCRCRFCGCQWKESVS